MKIGHGLTVGHIVKKRKLYCWLPRMGSDGYLHWFETIERWELHFNAEYRVIHAESGQCISSDRQSLFGGSYTCED